MRAVLIALALPLAGCTVSDMIESSQRQCAELGYGKFSPGYQECIEAGVAERQAQVERFRAGLANAAAISNAGTPAPYSPAGGRFYRGERIDGMNKLCIYNTLSGTEVVTIRSVDLCPLN